MGNEMTTEVNGKDENNNNNGSDDDDNNSGQNPSLNIISMCNDSAACFWLNSENRFSVDNARAQCFVCTFHPFALLVISQTQSYS